jgi:hypothetical protein
MFMKPEVKGRCANCGKKLAADGARKWPFADKLCECPKAPTAPDDEDRWRRVDGDERNNCTADDAANANDDWERIPSLATTMQMDSSELPLAEDPGAVRWSRASVQTGAGSKPNGPAGVDGHRSTKDDAGDEGDAESTRRVASSGPGQSPLLKQTQMGEVVSTSRVESSCPGQLPSLKQSQAGATDAATAEESSWARQPGLRSPAPALDIVVPGASSSSVPDPDSLPARPSLKLVEKDIEPIESKWALSPETSSGETATVFAEASSASTIEIGRNNDKPVKAPPAVPKLKRF